MTIAARMIRILTVLVGLSIIVVFIVILRFTRPLRGCGNPDEGTIRPGISVRTVESGGQRRCYMLYVPVGYNEDRPAPLVISIPAFAGNPEFQRYVTRWESVADQHHFLLVFPQGTSFPIRFNAGPVYNIPETDDVQFFRDLITELGQLTSVDRSRVYINGMSAGAHMAYRLGCELSDLVASIGMVSGAYLEFPGECTPQRPVPMIAFCGLGDPFGICKGRREDRRWILAVMRAIDLAPGAVIDIPAFQPWAGDWAARNGCDPDPEPMESWGSVLGARYIHCDDGAEVEIYTIEGGGHTWPGGGPTYLGKTSRDVKASELMWKFFERHSLPPRP